MTKLFLVRHGQSTWNAANRFSGWVDVPLNKKGRQEAFQAA
ncbi:histidine phosphatase family protein [Halotia wernerae UHCC 0503]|nr:histidine phosphatase family protein [Halotia wernerae UHCC 0503]